MPTTYSSAGNTVVIASMHSATPQAEISPNSRNAGNSDVDITRNEQFEPAFLRISPNNRVPAIVDHDAPEGSRSVFESGAILVYLAEKTGRFLPASGPQRTAALEWLFWQMGGLGPMAGQAHHFRRYAPEGNEYGKERYTKETARLYGVLDRRLAGREWIVDDYGIADMACWGWVWFHRMHGQKLDDFPEGAALAIRAVEPDLRALRPLAPVGRSWP